MNVSITNVGDNIVVKTGLPVKVFQRLKNSGPRATTLYGKTDTGESVPEFVMTQGPKGEFGAHGIVCDSTDVDGTLIAQLFDPCLAHLSTEHRVQALAEQYATAISNLEALLAQMAKQVEALNKAEAAAAKQITVG